ncbi:hypothetical protein EVAR_98929_1 [Eumeta japonica]|uniref:Uncharacterized protein n=1 Tax=Eumeta variegata TaxID=151549 RepID=A0A4C2A369_EUMVA|nr:hypothetical protein EVAR_98929_1 [Eumeta japonica]
MRSIRHDTLTVYIPPVAERNKSAGAETRKSHQQIFLSTLAAKRVRRADPRRVFDIEMSTFRLTEYSHLAHGFTDPRVSFCGATVVAARERERYRMTFDQHSNPAPTNWKATLLTIRPASIWVFVFCTGTRLYRTFQVPITAANRKGNSHSLITLADYAMTQHTGHKVVLEATTKRCYRRCSPPPAATFRRRTARRLHDADAPSRLPCEAKETRSTKPTAPFNYSTSWAVVAVVTPRITNAISAGYAADDGRSASVTSGRKEQDRYRERHPNREQNLNRTATAGEVKDEGTHSTRTRARPVAYMSHKKNNHC